MSDKMGDLEKQVMKYKERMSYHDSVEEELKKNIESQVDVVLKMEEERLILMKKEKELIESNRILHLENEDKICKQTEMQENIDKMQ